MERSKMKKSNITTLIILLILSLAVIIFASCSIGSKTNQADQTEPPAQAESSSAADNDNYSDTDPASLTNALFIGDSRTVGLMEYAGLDGADFFCNTGMNVFDVLKSRVSVPNVGKVTLSELLSNKNYGKIFIMLGINELGYSLDSVTAKYSEVLDFIKSAQPDADIIIQANLHVSKTRSDSDDYINNSAINNLNSKLSQLSDGKRIFYIDANPLFDDSQGNLSADKTSDNAHLYAKYYAQWGKWICGETEKLLRRDALD